MTPSEPASRLPLRTHLGYGLADFGQNILFQSVVIYLPFFYTDVAGIDATFAANLFLLARFWDGFTDSAMGYLAQRTRTRWGTYRPYLLWMALPLAISMVGLFYVPESSGTLKSLYAILSYLFFGLAFTGFNIPYGALTAVMTTDYHERGKLTGFRMTFAMLGGIAAATLIPPLVQSFPEAKTGYQLMAWLGAGVILLCAWIGFATVKEQVSFERERFPGWRAVGSILRNNGQLLRLCLGFGACFAAWALFAGAVPYYTKYYLQDESMSSWILLTVMGLTAASIPVWAAFARRIGKKPPLLVGLGFYLLAFLLWPWVQPGQVGTMMVLATIQGIGNGSAVFASWAMLPDTVEYGTLRSQYRAEGIYYGFYSFSLKVGLGLGALALLLSLNQAGYQKDMPQPDSVLDTLRMLMGLVPAGLIGVAGLAFWGYQLSPERHREIQSELDRRDSVSSP